MRRSTMLIAVVAVMLGVLALSPAQAADVFSVRDNDVLFQTADQNMWASGPALKIEASFSHDFLDVPFDPISLGGFVSIPFIGDTGLRASFGGGLELGVSGKFSATGGEVDVDYQADIVVSALTASGGPMSSVTSGELFILRALEFPDANAMAMETEFANIEAGLFLDYALDVNASLLGKLFGRTVVNVGVNESFSDSIELIGATLSFGDPPVGEVRLLAGVPVIGKTWALEDEMHKELSGGIITLDGYLPSLDTGVPGDSYDFDSAWDGTTGTLTNSQLPMDRSNDPVYDDGRTRIDFFKLGIGLDDIVSKITKIPLTVSAGNDAVSLDVTLLDANLEAYLGLAQEMTFTPDLSVRYSFSDGQGSPVYVSVETTSGSRVFEPVTSVTAAVGQDLRLVHPGGTLRVDTVYGAAGSFSNETDVYLSPAFTLAIGEFDLSGSLVEKGQDLGLLPDDLSFSLYRNTFALGDPIPIIELVDRTFDLRGFNEVDGSNLLLTGGPPTVFTVLVAPDDDPNITEGEAMRLTGTIYDPVGGATDGSDTYSLTIDWKDGTTQTVTLDGNTTASIAGVTYDPTVRVFTVSHRYVDENGSQRLSFTATRTSDTTQTDEDTPLVVVTNVAPTVSYRAHLVLDNSGNATLAGGSFTDPGLADTHTVTLDWGDGTSATFSLPAIGAASNPLSVNDTITSGSHTLTVNDVAPTVSLDGPDDIVGPGGLALLTGTIGDTGRADAFEMRVDWGDGSTFDNDDDSGTADDAFEVFTFGPSATGSQAFVVPHVYPQDLDGGSHTATATVFDDDGLSGSSTRKIYVDWDLPPRAFDDHFFMRTDEVLVFDVFADNDLDGKPGDPNTAVDITTVDCDPEGALDRSRTRIPGDVAVVIQQLPVIVNDLVTHHGNGVFTFDPTSSQAFAAMPVGDQAQVLFIYQIEDTGGQTSFANVIIDVERRDDGPTVTSGDAAIAVAEGSAASTVVTCNDAGQTGQTTVSANVESLTPLQDGDWTWTHTPADGPDDTQIVEITAEDASGATRTLYFPLTVTNVAPTIALSGDSTTYEGSPYGLTLGSVTDPGDDKVTSYTVNWGDGSSDTYGSDGIVFHIYTDGTVVRTITVDLVDGDGTHVGAGSHSVTVQNLPPTIDSVASDGPVGEGSPVMVTVSASDPAGDNDPLNYSFDFDNDGTYEIWKQAGSSASHTFGDDGSYTVNVIVDDGENWSSPSFTVVTVSNVAPVVTAPLTVNTDEDAAPQTLELLTGAWDPAGEFDTLSLANLTLASGNASGVTIMGNSLSTNPSAYNSLPLGQSEVIIYNYNVTDEDGGSVSQTATITVEGRNDVPVVSNAIAEAVEDGDSIRIFTEINDVDSDDDATTLALSTVSPLSEGAIYPGRNGTFIFDPRPDFQDLAAGQRRTVIFRYRANDRHFATSGLGTITIHVTGRNDQPTVLAVNTATNDGAGAFSLNLLVAGSAADVDASNQLSVSALTLVSGQEIDFSLNGSNIELDPSQFDDLGAGESETLVFEFSVSDDSGAANDTASSSVTITVEGFNDAPTLTVDRAAVTVDEGKATSNSGTFSDIDRNDTITLTASVGMVTAVADGIWGWSFNASDGPAESQTVTITANDGNGGTAKATFELVVNNVAPSVGIITGPVDPVQASTEEVTASAGFTDPGVLDSHTATWHWGDGCESDGDVTEANGSGSVSGTHHYAGPGVYTVVLTVTDKDGAVDSSTYQYVVVYDPEGGFVTGGGWITSPLGAYIYGPTLGGKASFGFVARYRKGEHVPDGQTDFHFRAAGLHFHSTSYQWLVIAGAKAQFKGEGTLNGAGSYGFLLTAIDGQQPGGGGADKFRIKIWDKANDTVVYDNKRSSADDADDATALRGGSIVIHKAK